jgi:DNA-binding transcriptional MerR regulator
MGYVRSDETLGIGEVATRFGVSVRALRLYEAAGLIAPLRTQAGRRVFQATDIARLRQVLALKRAGLTLGRIRAALASSSLAAADLIDQQITLLEAQHAALERSLRGLRAAQAKCRAGGSISLAQFCDLITTGDTMMSDAWQSVFERYYSKEDMARWEQAKGQFTEADQHEAGAAWSALIGRVEAAIAAGEPADGEIAISLAQEWIELQRPVMEAVGAPAWNKAAQMYQEMEAWQTDTVRAPFSMEVYAFVQAAAEAGRARGVIAPWKG